MRTKSINYLESRTINIGDYEKINSQLSYTVEESNINNVEKTATVSHIEYDNVGDSFKEASRRIVKRVRSVLDKREYEIRKLTSDYVDFDTDGKAKIVKPKKKKIKKTNINDDLDLS